MELTFLAAGLVEIGHDQGGIHRFQTFVSTQTPTLCDVNRDEALSAIWPKREERFPANTALRPPL